MTIPVNNTNTGTAGSVDIDWKVVVASMYSNLKSAEDLGADYSDAFVTKLNGKHASVAVVRKRPTLTLSATPADRDGLLPRTGVTGGSVEVLLKQDRYFKVPVDQDGVEPGTVEAEIGVAGAEAIVRYGNSELLDELAAEGTSVYFGKTFGTTKSAQDVWTAALAQKTFYQKGEYTLDVVAYFDAEVWNTLIGAVETLRYAIDQQEAAAKLLGVTKVRVVNLPAGVLAVFAHRGAVAQAKILNGIKSTVEDFDTLVEGRVKVGTNVLEAAAVRVIRDGVAPQGS